MLPNKDTNDALGAEDQKAVETGTPSGRTYTKKRWTLGDSRELVEGQAGEPLALTISWIVVPLLVGLILIGLMTV
jgi:hypothetical protein